jgi:hypothetical protein
MTNEKRGKAYTISKAIEDAINRERGLWGGRY